MVVQYTDIMIFLPFFFSFPYYVEITKCLSDTTLNQNPNHFKVVKFVDLIEHHMTPCDAYTIET